MDKINLIEMDENEAKEQWEEYKTFMENKGKELDIDYQKKLKDMEECLSNLRRGKQLLDIYSVLKEVGLNETGDPKIAIARADWKRCVFVKQEGMGGRFRVTASTWGEDSGELFIPAGTFSDWKCNDPLRRRVSGNISREVIETEVPIIPPHLITSKDISNYYILYEVREWNIPRTKTGQLKNDPILLKKITNNIFVVLNTWDMTELEQSIIRG